MAKSSQIVKIEAWAEAESPARAHEISARIVSRLSAGLAEEGFYLFEQIFEKDLDEKGGRARQIWKRV